MESVHQIKIRLTCNWCSDRELYERFSRAYVSELNYNPNIIFTNSSNFDWLVVINYPSYQINFPKEKTIGVIMEPSWTEHYKLRYILENKCRHILTHTVESNNQYVYYPGLLPYHFNSLNNNIDYYINNSFEKTKTCSMIVSYNNSSPHSNCLYKQRTEFAKKILKTDLDVDIYGNNWNNSGILDQRIKGQIVDKDEALKDYNFSIAIENCIEADYFTEKITDCILTNTTPIYYGCPKINRFLTGVYELPTIDNTEELQSILKQPSLKQNKQQLATKYNLYTALVKYINNIETKK